ncbi:phosphoglycerate mutase family protein [Microbacterium oxydans]|nr:phosphoglycerate mutase family protein [Microbacterium oxydans]
MARALQPIAAAAVYCSPLQRAVSTAQVIATDWESSLPLMLPSTTGDYGPWTGELKSSVVDRWGSVDAAPGSSRSSPCSSGLDPGSIGCWTSTRVDRWLS